MKILSLLFLAIALVFGSGCDRRSHTKTVHVYKKTNTNYVAGATTTNNHQFTYYYLFNYNNHVYFHESQDYVDPTEYDHINWVENDVNGIEIETLSNDPNSNVAEFEQQTVPNEAFGQEMDNMFDTTDQQISDMISEGNPNNQDSTSDSSDSSSSSDSGSSDGGGDGGGGGE